MGILCQLRWQRVSPGPSPFPEGRLPVPRKDRRGGGGGQPVPHCWSSSNRRAIETCSCFADRCRWSGAHSAHPTKALSVLPGRWHSPRAPLLWSWPPSERLGSGREPGGLLPLLSPLMLILHRSEIMQGVNRPNPTAMIVSKDEGTKPTNATGSRFCRATWWQAHTGGGQDVAVQKPKSKISDSIPRSSLHGAVRPNAKRLGCR